MFHGSMVALITPFDEQGNFAEDTYRELIEFQIENGTDVIVPCGTTGESTTLLHSEHDQVIKSCIEQVNKRIPVLAGTGSNSTREAIALSQHAKEMGADGLMLVSPYYNRPTQEGIYQHYKTLAESVALPQVMYNVPPRTGRNVEADTVVRLAEFDNIVAIKEASGNLIQASEIIAKAGAKIDVISGDDFLTVPLMSCGAKGIISVTANIAPAQVKRMVQAVQENRWDDARQMHLDLLELNSLMFIEASPTPAKTAAELMGLCRSEVRLPLVPLQEKNLETLKQTLKKYALI